MNANEQPKVKLQDIGIRNVMFSWVMGAEHNRKYGDNDLELVHAACTILQTFCMGRRRDLITAGVPDEDTLFWYEKSVEAATMNMHIHDRVIAESKE